MKRSNPPNPSEVLEELASEVLASMDRGAVASFSNALNAMIDIHVFLLRAYATVDKNRRADGHTFGLTESFPNTPIHIRWNREYRRIFQRAGDLLGHDREFFKMAAEVPCFLVDRTADAVPSKVLESLLNLTLYLFRRGEDWWLQRAIAEVGKRPNIREPVLLSGYEAEIYGKAMRDFTSKWEEFQYFPKDIWKWDAESYPPDKRWDRLSMSSGFIRENLFCTAYMVAESVWRGDELSASIMSDSLIMWIRFFDYELLKYGYVENSTSFIDIDFFEHSWSDVLKNFEANDSESGHDPEPEMVFWNIIENLWVDVVLNLSAIIMSWGSEWSDRDSISSRVSRKLLSFDIDDQPMYGMPFRKISTNRIFMSLARQYASKDPGYRGWLNDLIYRIDRLSEEEMIPGRLYPVSTKRELNELKLFHSAILISKSSSYTLVDFSTDIKREIIPIRKIFATDEVKNLLKCGLKNFLESFEEDMLFSEYKKISSNLVEPDKGMDHFDERKVVAKSLLENFPSFYK